MNSAVLQQLLTKWLDSAPILVDVGAAGAPPAIWDPIAPNSIFVGFDPDRRQTEELPPGRFLKSVLVNKAVTAHAGVDTVPLYLTRSP